MKKLMTNLSILATSMLVIGNANADVRVNGFANFTAGITASDDALYGFDDRVSFSEQSLFAVQVSGDINDKMTATGQIVARGSEDFDASFDWAYITYAATDNTSVSAGRLRLPLFQYSASLDVAYSYHWVIAPQSIYNVPFNNIDGVRIDHSGYAGDWEYSFQATGGAIDNDFELGGQPGQIAIDNVVVLSGELAYESWKFRGVYGIGKVTFDLPALNPALGQLGQISAELGSTLAAIDDTGTFSGLSIVYDNFNWFVASEFTLLEIEQSYYPKNTSYYVTAGYRAGKWTPFITYEKNDSNNDPKFVEQIGGFPAPFQGPLTQLVVGIQQGVASEDSTLSVGIRYDFDTNVALKADISKNTNDINDDENTLMRFAINYVF
jgi:hypothetical protein